MSPSVAASSLNGSYTPRPHLEPAIRRYDRDHQSAEDQSEVPNTPATMGHIQRAVDDVRETQDRIERNLIADIQRRAEVEREHYLTLTERIKAAEERIGRGADRIGELEQDKRLVVTTTRLMRWAIGLVGTFLVGLLVFAWSVVGYLADARQNRPVLMGLINEVLNEQQHVKQELQETKESLGQVARP